MITLTDELAGHRHFLDADRGITRYLTDFRDDWRPRLSQISYAYDYADFTVTDRPHRRKYVCPTGDVTRPFTPDDYAAGATDAVTRGEKARIYFDHALELAGRKWVGYRRQSRVFLNVTDEPWAPRQPAYYSGGHIHGRFVLIDLDRAYWQIASSGTADMDVHLRPGGGIRVGDGSIEWPRPADVAQDARLGQAIIGLAHMTEGVHVRYGQPQIHPVRNTYLAPDLYAYILFVLQAVAYEAVHQWGCPHVCIDSYAIHETKSLDFLDWLQSRWSLNASVRARGTAHYYGYCLYEYLPTHYGDMPAATAWVTDARQTTGRPPEPRGPTGNLVGRHDVTRDQLAAIRRWLIARRTLTPRHELWEPLDQHHPDLEWRAALT